MKKTFLLSTVIFLFGQMNAQITLEREDLTVQPGSTIIKMMFNADSLETPTEGADQIWDYTGLELTNIDTLTLTPFDGTEYPSANIAFTEIANITSGGVLAPFPYTEYQVLNDTVHGRIGARYEPVDIPLVDFTVVHWIQ